MRPGGALLILIFGMAGTLWGQGRPDHPPRRAPIATAGPAPKEDPPDGLAPLSPNERLPLPVPAVPTLRPHPPAQMLSLKEVLISVERSYPLLAAAAQERIIASGRVLSAAGQFDTQINGHVRQNQGSFDNQRYRLDFTQPTAFQGITFGGGWRLGSGIYPVYYQDRQTAVGGEFFGGVTVPLLKNREIDARRAGAQQAWIDQQIAEPLIASQRVEFIRNASWAFWSWSAAAGRLEIGQELLSIAEQRDELLRKQAKLGRIAEIEITDNRRTIQDRRARLARLLRAFEQASLDLSLFVRDEKGVPVNLTYPTLAPDIPPPGRPVPEKLTNGIETALNIRPELQQIRLRIDRTAVRLNLARNQVLPDLRFYANHATDVGSEKKSLDRYSYEAGLLLEVPLQRRQALGQVRTAQGEMAQLHAREAFLRESITTQVQKAVSGILRAYEVSQRAQEAVRLARVMERAEQRKLDLGKSNILFVNLRELARADAQAQVVDAFAEYHRAWAGYRAALGLTIPKEWLSPPPAGPAHIPPKKPKAIHPGNGMR